MSKSEDDKLEEARKTLLQHFSSKSTLQATILLSLAIAFFAFIQTVSQFEKLDYLYQCLYYSFVLTAFIFLTMRAFGRLIYWAKMTGLVERIRSKSEKELKREFKKKKEKDFVPTYLNRVECACNAYLGKSRVHVMFHWLTNKRWVSIAFCLKLFTLFVLSFTFYFQISDGIVIRIIVCILAFLAFVVDLHACIKGIKKENK